MPCFVITAFLWSFIYVKTTRCNALLLWPFFGLLSMSRPQDAMLCNCGLSLVFYLCQVHKMQCFVITAFFGLSFVKFTRCCALLLWPFLVFYLCQIHKMPCFVIVAFLWSFIYVKFTRCRALLLWPFLVFHLSSSQDAVLCYCGLSLVFYLCQVH